MSSWTKPTDELIEKALSLGAKPEYARDFFERLENPEWVEPLRARGYFKNPPGRVLEDEERTIALPRWALSRYLVRMASNEPDYAEVVQRALLAIPETDNDAIHEDIVTAAAKLPGTLAKAVAKREVKWLRSIDQVFGLSGRRFASLIVRMAADGEQTAALELAASLLHPRKGRNDDLRGMIDSYDYEKVVETILSPLVTADATEALQLFCRLLTSALNTKRNIDKAPHDYSYIWHAHIDVDDNPGDSIEGILVTAVRDAALEAIRLDATRFPQVVDLLMQQRWLVFRRISLLLLTRYWQTATDRARDEVLNRANFDEYMIRREYDALVHEVLCSLPQDERHVFFQWVAAGPDLDTHREFLARWSDGESNEEEELAKYAREWKRDRLRAVARCIPADLQPLSENLPAFERDAEAEIARITNTWMESPLDATDLSKLQVPEVLAYLAKWTPGRDDLTSRVELGREVEKVIASRAGDFLASADEFKHLHPTYARALIEGLSDALKAGTPIDWSRALAFAEWAVTATYAVEEITHGITDPDYSWTRGAIMRLLQAGFRASGAAAIPADRAPSVWGVIRVVTDDPDPSRGEPLPMNTDPSTQALNTNRGQAFHTLISYLVWLHTTAGPRFGQHETIRAVEEVLTDHLTADEAPAILSIYGQYFPWLLKLLPDWTARHRDQIFPTEDPAHSVWPYTWPSYLAFCGAYNDVFAAITDKYQIAATNASTPYPMWSSLANPAKKLMEHIVVLYGRGVLDDNHDILKSAVASASPELRAHAIWFANNVLNTEPEWATEAVIARFQHLWERHMAGKSDEDARAIGWFSLSAAIPADWFLKHLIDVLRRFKAISGDHWVMERLAATAEKHPRSAVEALLLLLDSSTDGVGVHGWRDEMAIVIDRAAKSPDEVARRIAAEVVNKLGRIGLKEYRALLVR
jgi:hypothetical protein